MFGIYEWLQSCSGDIHIEIVAAFTTKEKAAIFLPKLQSFFPKGDFRISEYDLPKVDPENIEDVIWEGVQHGEASSNEAETLLQHKGLERRNDNNDLRRLLEL